MTTFTTNYLTMTRAEYDAMVRCFPQFMQTEWSKFQKTWSVSLITVQEPSYQLEHLLRQIPTRKDAVIQLDGNWADGWRWKVISSMTGNTIKESGPYHQTRYELARDYAIEDAKEWATKNDWNIIRHT